MDIDIFLQVSFFILGSIIGSFLNVCIVRMPENRSIAFPSSHCPLCKAPIKWFDNIPLVSFLMLGAKCRACKAPIPWRYFFVELFTAVVFWWTFVVFGLSWVLVPALVLLSGLIVASVVDLGWRIIPDEISVGGMWVGLVLSILFPMLHRGPAVEVINTGNIVALALVGVCVALHLLKMLKNKQPFTADDRTLFLLGASFLVLQWVSFTLAKIFPAVAVPLSALADALQGALIGACALWVTGLIGEVIITKRVVTEFDFKGMVDDPADLMKVLVAAHYVDKQGNLQKSFRAVGTAGELQLVRRYEPKRKDIFEMLQAVDEGGVMGWGDVKLLAMAGAFLGWQLALVAFFIAPFFGAFFGIIKILRKQDTAIAYGPFLAIGIAASLFWGDLLLRWFISMYAM